MQTADVQRRELLERGRRQVDAAGCAARASVCDCNSHGLAVRPGHDHLAAAYRVPVRKAVSIGRGAGGTQSAHALGFAPAPGKFCIVAMSTATMKSASVLKKPHEPVPAA